MHWGWVWGWLVGLCFLQCLSSRHALLLRIQCDGKAFRAYDPLHRIVSVSCQTEEPWLVDTKQRSITPKSWIECPTLRK